MNFIEYIITVIKNNNIEGEILMNTVHNISSTQDLKMVPSIHIQESPDLKVKMEDRCKTIIDENKTPVKML